MKKILTLLAFLTIFGANAQEQETVSPDYAAIKTNTQDPSSPYYYPVLLTRFNAADTSMTVQERRHLYYGYTFNENSVNHANVVDAEMKLGEILHKQSPTAQDMEDVVAYTTTILEAFPFSVNVTEYRMYCLKALNRHAEAAKDRERVAMIIDAMLSSGDGTSPETSIHVIDAQNKYELVGALGYATQGEEYLISNKYNYLIIDENAYNVPGLFFDVATFGTSTAKAVTGL